MFAKFGTKLKSKVKWWFSKKGIEILQDGGPLTMREYVPREYDDEDEEEEGDDGDDGEWR
jgi:hypothetical protein